MYLISRVSRLSVMSLGICDMTTCICYHYMYTYITTTILPLHCRPQICPADSTLSLCDRRQHPVPSSPVSGVVSDCGGTSKLPGSQSSKSSVILEYIFILGHP